jgi:hypothetical protein
MPALWPLTFIVLLFLQSADVSRELADILNPDEKARLEKGESIEQRIKVYEAASKRIQQSLETAVSKEDSQAVSNNLTIWTSLLSKSLEDIEANANTRKQSNALKGYEIQLRKAIASTESYKIKVPVDLQDAFEACLAHAETVRKKFVELLFPQP